MAQMAHPFGWHEVDSSKAADIRSKLGHFEKRTWNEILVKSKKQNHSIPVDALCGQAQKRIRELKLVSDEVVSLRLSAKERVVGIMQDDVLLILWWDPDHSVCPSLPK